MNVNYTALDVSGALLACLLFAPIFLAPGYVIGWLLDLFEFRRRQFPVQITAAILLSMSVSPVLLFLVYRLASGTAAMVLLLLFCIAFAWIVFRQAGTCPLWAPGAKQFARWAALAAGLWVLFAVVFLADWQWGDRLYFTVVSYDHTTRASIIDAITRSGVPPNNPSYFPGHTEKLTFVYYFWYVLASLVDQLGGRWVEARMALTASIAWCGLGLMAAVAFYLRQRRSSRRWGIWKTALIGIGCLAITGLDLLPVLGFLLRYHFDFVELSFTGDIELWNEQITAWVPALLWVPHHTAALIACLTGVMLVHSVWDAPSARRVPAMIVAGLAFASACGLSVWVTLVFVLFWALWLGWLLMDDSTRPLAWMMVVPGVVALLAILPFLLDWFGAGASDGSAAAPLTLAVRILGPVAPIVNQYPEWMRPVLFIALLPVGYLMELGFFFVAGLYWLQMQPWKTIRADRFKQAEVLLLAVVFFLASFVRSTLIHNNDFGWRSWMPGQFVLLIWGVDIIERTWGPDSPAVASFLKFRFPASGLRKTLVALAALGILSSAANLFVLRAWPMLIDAGVEAFPNRMSPDAHLGERTFAGRQAYEFIDENLPAGIVLQFNPFADLDRPGGLYRTRQAVISDHAAYGVPRNVFVTMARGTGAIFDMTGQTDWVAVDALCDRYSIDVLVLNDTDPLWTSLDTLQGMRRPLYHNDRFAIYACGRYAAGSRP